MAAIGTALMSRVLGHSAAEKAFRPWWDSLEDFLIYGLVMLGIIIVPTAIITGTPLDCNYCQEDFCQNVHEPFNQTNVGKEDPKFNAWWIKKFCTLNGAVPAFMLYFPYFLLMVALVLVFIERVFQKAFNAGSKLDKFYSVLVREKVLKAAEKANVCEVGDSIVDGKEAIEIKQSFKGNGGYFYSYMMRTFIEVSIACLLLTYMLYSGLPILEASNTVICPVHGFFYECNGQPAQFYSYILYITIAITIMYILCNFYNIMWLLFPCFGRLSRVMDTYRHNMRARGANEGKHDKEILGDLWEIYYNNRDLRLLLDLLATSSGIAPAIAIMTLFDKKFQNAMKPKIRYVAASRELGICEIQFAEPKTGVRYALNDIPGVHLMYMAEISPPADTDVVAFDKSYIEDDNQGENTADVEMAPLVGFVQKACFAGLKKDETYTLKVSTVLNGRTIAHVQQEIERKHERLPVDELAVETAKKEQGVNGEADALA